MNGKLTILILTTAIFRALADPPPLPSPLTNSPATSTNFTGMPPDRIVENGVHALWNWRLATNNPPQSPLISVVLTNNQAEWSTNMIGSTNLYAHGKIFGWGNWVTCIWFDPNTTNREYQFTFNLQQTNWGSLGFNSNSNPRYPEWVSTLVRLPPFPPDTDKMFFRLKRGDLGLH